MIQLDKKFLYHLDQMSASLPRDAGDDRDVLAEWYFSFWEFCQKTTIEDIQEIEVEWASDERHQLPLKNEH
jgi:hypothetical protein